jgi:hypothetical protein
VPERSLEDWTPVIGPSAAGVTHVESDATANFVISPIQGTGVRYSGTYREHAIGNCLIINNEDIPTPRHPSTCRPPPPDGDGSQIPFTIRGHAGRHLPS